MAIIGDSRISLPLISFHAIIDEDMAIIAYILLEMRDESLFDLYKVSDKTYHKILSEIYWGGYKNPLYYFMKNESDKEKLDEIYNDLITNHEDKILKHGVSTEIYRLIQEFARTPEISPTILCYNDIQINYLTENAELDKITLMNIKDINKNKYTEYYFRNVEEFDEFKDSITNSTVYISTMAKNFRDEKEGKDIDISNDDMIATFRRGNRLNIYDIYRSDIIGGYDTDETDDK